MHIRKLTQGCKSELAVIDLGWSGKEEYLRLDPTEIFLGSASSFFKEIRINYYSLSQDLTRVHENRSLFVIQNNSNYKLKW